MEIFGAGTAAVVSPVNKILHLDDVIEIENNGFPLAQRFFDELTSIQVIPVSYTHLTLPTIYSV